VTVFRPERWSAGAGEVTGSARYTGPSRTCGGGEQGKDMSVRPIQGGRSGHRADGNVATATTGPGEGGDAVQCICRCSAVQFAVRVRLGQPARAIIWAG
jgi:hypothetical protein